jgi:hypothetical protein
MEKRIFTRVVATGVMTTVLTNPMFPLSQAVADERCHGPLEVRCKDELHEPVKAPNGASSLETTAAVSSGANAPIRGGANITEAPDTLDASG